MYSRNYYSDEGSIKIPDNYDGTSLLENNVKEEKPQLSRVEIPKADTKISPKDEKEEEHEVFLHNEQKTTYQKDRGFDLASILRGFNFKDIHIGTLIPKIGTEELLLIALAAFLFLSKCGDKECAILIFLLIFIG